MISNRFICKLAIAIAACGIATAKCSAQTPSDVSSSDIVLINGKIITVDAKDSIVQALAIHNGKIASIGSNEKIMALAAKNAKVIDLRGRTVTPGLIDTHCHFDETERIYGIELSKITKIPEALELVSQQVATHKIGEWITGSGWDEGKLAELRYITAADLDKVSPSNPVWLQKMGR